MSSLSVKAPKDPNVAARAAEQQRADSAFVSNTQGLLDQEMRKRVRRLGARASLAGTPGAVAGGYSATGSGSGSQYIPMIDPGSFEGGGFRGLGPLP